MSQYKNIWNEVGQHLLEKLRTEPVKGEYVHGKLKTWKEQIKISFHVQDVPYDTYYNATAELKIGSVYKQGKNCHPQIYVEECKYTDAKNRQCNMLSDDDDDDDGFLRCKKERKKDFCNLPKVYKN